MIKLIATDMDGTLLDENNKLPEDFFPMLHRLNDQNIRFAVASGRPYKTLYENFRPYSDEMYFICDNGAYIVEPNKEPIISIIDKEMVNEIVTACDKIEGTHLLICGKKHFYHKPFPAHIGENILKYYKDLKCLSDLHNIDDDIFKIAICDEMGSKDHAFPILNDHFGNEMKVVVSGELWLDINNKGINKGVALKQLQKDFSITREETMAFGDFYNDIELLQAADYSFVMENANEDMKQYGRFIAKPNSENGVLSTIEEYVFCNLA
ncbi:Cof-type HAD-IIB family hydrolase [Lachnospiraceae bacterium KM106-2]|nr:Cof-type HAD-IIB family hydrolase [Lachnospiraceae bacterium KM106-2]